MVGKSERGQLINDMPDDKAEDGRGLQLTEALADEWDLMVEGDQVVTYARFRPIRQEPGDQTPPHAA